MAVAESAAGLCIIDLIAEAAEAAIIPGRTDGILISFATCDIGTAPTADEVFASVAAEVGRVDKLVNSAANYPCKQSSRSQTPTGTRPMLST